MLVDELLELAQRIIRTKSEEQTVEVKAAAQGCPKRLYDTLSSFSNQDTGGTRSSLALTKRMILRWSAYMICTICRNM